MSTPGRPEPAADAQHLSGLVVRLRAGDDAAREELIRASLDRLDRLARKMLRRFPRVRRWEETADVLQLALVRLDRALREVVPGSSREYFALAAEQVRRVLLDLVRQHHGAHGVGRNHESDPGHDVPDGADDPAELDRWAAFHEAVAGLPAEQREVFMLSFYHDWTQAQIAEMFGVGERTVRRRWQAAGLELGRRLGGNLPGG